MVLPPLPPGGVRTGSLHPESIRGTPVGALSEIPADLKPACSSSATGQGITVDARLREYFCYVLLDFAKVDPDLDDMPLAATLQLSQQLELDAQFEKLAAKELGLKVRDVRKTKEQAAEMLAKAEAEADHHE